VEEYSGDGDTVGEEEEEEEEEEEDEVYCEGRAPLNGEGGMGEEGDDREGRWPDGAMGVEEREGR